MQDWDSRQAACNREELEREREREREEYVQISGYRVWTENAKEECRICKGNSVLLLLLLLLLADPGGRGV